MNSPRAHGSHRLRPVVAAAGAVALGAMVSLAGADTAMAAGDYLEFSVDGKTFAPAVAGPLFNQDFTYVPGTSSSTTLWIRNNSNEPASLSYGAVIVRSDRELNGYLGLAAGEPAGVSSRAALGLQGTCSDVGQAWDLQAGEEMELEFVMDMALEAPNDTRNRQAEVDVVFLLESKAAGAAPRAACNAWGSGPGGTDSSEEEPAAGSLDDSGNSATAVGAEGAAQAGAGTQGEGSTQSGDGVGSSPAQSPGLAIVAGTGGPETFPSADNDVNTETGQRLRGTLSRGAAPEEIAQAGFSSTVEPIIRSWSGTLLIAMSMVLSAALILRTRKRQA